MTDIFDPEDERVNSAESKDPSQTGRTAPLPLDGGASQTQQPSTDAGFDVVAYLEQRRHLDLRCPICPPERVPLTLAHCETASHKGRMRAICGPLPGNAA